MLCRVTFSTLDLFLHSVLVPINYLVMLDYQVSADTNEYSLYNLYMIINCNSHRSYSCVVVSQKIFILCENVTNVAAIMIVQHYLKP